MPDLFWLIAASGLGPFIGSFLGLVSLRLPAGRDVIVARSACDGCGRKLGVADLVPLLSFVILRGKCRTCDARIPWRYPLIEGGCLILALWAGLILGGPLGFLSALLGWWLLLIAIVDGEHFWLPDLFTWPLALFGLMVTFFIDRSAFPDHLIGAVIGFAVIWGFGWGYKKLRGFDGLGGGDARLMAAAGAWVGWQGLASVLLWGAGLGLVAALILAVTGKVKLQGRLKMPFGTFLAAGLWLIWLYGPLGL